jgi:hypothetical protein
MDAQTEKNLIESINKMQHDVGAIYEVCHDALIILEQIQSRLIK